MNSRPIQPDWPIYTATRDRETRPEASENTPASRSDVTRDPNFAGSLWHEQDQRSPKGTVIGVVAGKGGVGKSSVSLWLAECLTASDQKVALIDANVGQPDISKMLTLRGLTSGLTALVGGSRITQRELDEAIYCHKDVGDVLIGPPEPIHVGFEPAVSALQESIRLLERSHDFVIIDSPVGTIIDQIVNRCVLPASDILVVVVNPHKPTIEDTAQWLWSLAQPITRGGYNYNLESSLAVLNKHDPHVMPLETVQSFLNTRIVATIDEVDEAVLDINSGLWRCPPAAQPGIANLARQLTGVDPIDAPPGSKKTGKGLMRRILTKLRIM